MLSVGPRSIPRAAGPNSAVLTAFSGATQQMDNLENPRYSHGNTQILLKCQIYVTKKPNYAFAF